MWLGYNIIIVELTRIERRMLLGLLKLTQAMKRVMQLETELNLSQVDLDIECVVWIKIKSNLISKKEFQDKTVAIF